MKEVWRDIYFVENRTTYDYRGLYQISNYGRVKSLYNNEILKCNISNNNYYYVILYKNKQKKHFLIHRLVANVFMPDKSNYKIMPNENKNEIKLNDLKINHKDENKQNNYIDNLEWCTSTYNNNYGSRKTKVSVSKSKKIYQYDLGGNFIKTWKNAVEINKKLNYNQGNINQCCNGKRKTAHKYIWKYEGGI